MPDCAHSSLGPQDVCAPHMACLGHTALGGKQTRQSVKVGRQRSELSVYCTYTQAQSTCAAAKQMHNDCCPDIGGTWFWGLLAEAQKYG